VPSKRQNVWLSRGCLSLLTDGTPIEGWQYKQWVRLYKGQQLIILMVTSSQLLEPVWQRGRGCVSLKTHWLSVWLRKKSYSLYMGPTMNCVRNAGNLKAEKCCFFARLFENNHATLFKQCSMIHCSLNSVSCLYCSLNSVSCLYCSLNSGACEQCELRCSREFFFCVLIFLTFVF